MLKVIAYTKLASTLKKLGAQLTASEAHGLLTGMLSLAKQPMKVDAWRATLIATLDCSQPNKQEWGVLSDASKQIMDEFTSNNFSFKLLLPADNSPLADRIVALSFWCRGYLSGLGLVGITQEDLANEIVQELVQDLSHIAHVSMDTDASDEDERNFVELVEYVRVAVQNIQLELYQLEQSRTLH